MKKSSFFAAIAAALMAAACSENSNNPEPEPIIDPVVEPVVEWSGQKSLNEVAEQNVGKANGFAIKLFRTVFNAKGGNVCVSPVSVLNVFAMMANGDGGATRDEILGILGYGEGKEALEDLNVYCNALLAEATSADGATLCEFTNSVWHRPDLDILPQFSSDIERIFGGTLFPIWIGDEAGKNAINKFVEEHTHGMIPEFLNAPLEVSLALLNTTYFKGTWELEFDNNWNYDNYFQNADGSQTMTTFMHMDTELYYCSAEGMRGVCLAYAGDRYAMTLIQPDATSDFDTMLSDMDATRLEALRKSAETKEVVLSVPKFETEFNAELDDQLKEMGFSKVFDPGIDKVTDSTLWLRKFIHAVKIIVDEQGTEAAGVSLGGMNEGVTGEDTYEVVNFNRPFVYIIKDTVSDTVLFMGAVTEF